MTTFVKVNTSSKLREPRMVGNLFRVQFNDLRTEANLGGGATGDGGAVANADGSKYTLSVGAAAGTAFDSLGSLDLVAGRFYAISMLLEDVTGTYTGDFIRVQAVTAPTEGVTSKTTPTNGYHMIVFQASITESKDLRWGYISSASNVSMTVSKLMVQEMVDMAELAPYVPPGYNNGTAQIYEFPLDVTDTGYWDSVNNLYVEGSYSKFNVRRDAIGIVISDSFANSITEYGGQIQLDLTRTGLYLNAKSGRTIAEIASEINTILGDDSIQVRFLPSANDTIVPTQTYYPYPKFAIINAGVNDINTTSDYSVVETVMSSIKTIVARCRAKDVVPIICSMPPWANATGFTHLNNDQIKTDGVNGKLESYCKAEGIEFIDIYSGLEGDVNADQIAMTINGDSNDYSTDNLHPDTTAGVQQMADLIKPAIRRLAAL